MNGRIKYLIKKKKAIFQKQKESNTTADYVILTHITLEFSNAITLTKSKYHERLVIKLNDLKLAPKTY